MAGWSISPALRIWNQEFLWLRSEELEIFIPLCYNYMNHDNGYTDTLASHYQKQYCNKMCCCTLNLILLSPCQVTPNLAETLFRYRTDIEIIFNIIDKDHSGIKKILYSLCRQCVNTYVY